MLDFLSDNNYIYGMGEAIMKTAKYKVGEHVASYNSGLVYIIKQVQVLDLTGETFAYAVRRLRGGAEYGATRRISEFGLVPLLSGDPTS